MKFIVLFLTVVLCTAVACHKNNTTPPPPPPPVSPDTTGSLNIDLTLNGDTFSIKSELIINESRSGRILLDTVTPPSTQVNVTLHTNATLFDVTRIVYRHLPFVYPSYTATVVTGVNPVSWTGWATATDPLRTVPLDSAHLYYKHIPASSGVEMFGSTNMGNYPWIIQFSSTYDSMEIPYLRSPGGVTYTVFPTKGLYLTYLPKASRDTIDCLTASFDSAVSLNYNTSPNFPLSSAVLEGIPDTADGNSPIVLYLKVAQPGDLTPQLMYPRSAHFQKYLQTATFGNSSTNETIQYMNYSSQVSSSVNYPVPGAYSLGATQNNNFSVVFNGTKPTTSVVTFMNDSIILNLNIPPDSTSLNAMAMITALKSKLLTDQNFGSLKLSSFGYTNVAGFDYSTYWSTLSNQARWLSGRLTHWVSYGKNF